MAKYFDWIGAKWQQVVPILTSSGAPDSGKMAQTGANGKFHLSLMADGVVPDQKTGVSNGAITLNDLCYIETAGTIARATAASAGPHEAMGFATSTVITGVSVTIQDQGIMSGFTGLTPGARYFLSDVTPGGVLIDPGPVGAGKIAQFIGYAMSATEINFEPDQPVWLA